ncbi:tetratricopeptide repeat protein [Streptomyces sp. NPDC058655]|uniref:tetratricopeptide repeat protein n=1 Tax=unclassified Streptomyces TaxID=2593676 RepID=UPI0036603858
MRCLGRRRFVKELISLAGDVGAAGEGAPRRFEEAIDAHTQHLDICRELGDRHSEAGALGNLGIALREARRFEQAIHAHTQSVAVFREFGDRHREGQALGNLGLALREVRQFEEAIDARYMPPGRSYTRTGPTPLTARTRVTQTHGPSLEP